MYNPWNGAIDAIAQDVRAHKWFFAIPREMAHPLDFAVWVIQCRLISLSSQCIDLLLHFRTLANATGINSMALPKNPMIRAAPLQPR